MVHKREIDCKQWKYENSESISFYDRGIIIVDWRENARLRDRVDWYDWVEQKTWQDKLLGKSW